MPCSAEHLLWLHNWAKASRQTFYFASSTVDFGRSLYNATVPGISLNLDITKFCLSTTYFSVSIILTFSLEYSSDNAVLCATFLRRLDNWNGYFRSDLVSAEWPCFRRCLMILDCGQIICSDISPRAPFSGLVFVNGFHNVSEVQKNPLYFSLPMCHMISRDNCHFYIRDPTSNEK